MTEVKAIEKAPFTWPDLAIRVGLFVVLWLLLHGSDWLSWWIGVPAIALATAVSLIVVPPISWRVSFIPLIRFVGYFLVKSFLSSVDVASRVFRWRIPLQPDMIVYHIRLSGDFPPVLMANVTSLLPGTLSVELKLERENEPKCLLVHTLDERDPVAAELGRLEAHIAAIYGCNLEEAAP
jgi:multicomponent Na+:H+ antiporter subunit E